jgi:hypothetical protein
MFKRLMLASAFLFASTVAANAVVLFSDDFNANVRGNNRVPIGWQVTSGRVNLQNPFAGQGIQIDMDGNTTAVSRIQTLATFNFVAGRTYEFAFSYGKRVNAVQYIGFGAGSFTSQLSAGGPAMTQMLQHAFTFVATSNFSSKLMFSGVVGNRAGMFIDNVRLSDVTPVPLPPGALLLVTGLCGISVLSRRRDG